MLKTLFALFFKKYAHRELEANINMYNCYQCLALCGGNIFSIILFKSHHPHQHLYRNVKRPGHN